ncbi:MAG: cell division protein SepF [Lactobacillales bacterium]|jgi:cell division inhibitor SepF|nr:cell division protein SepF [Lactobacillales bacterium]
MAPSFLSKISKFFGLDDESEFDDFESDIDEDGHESITRKKNSQVLKTTTKIEPSYRIQIKEKLTRSNGYRTKPEVNNSSLANRRFNGGTLKVQNNGYTKVGPRPAASPDLQKASLSHLEGSNNVVSIKQAAQKMYSNASSYTTQSPQINSSRKMHSKVQTKGGTTFKIAIKEPRVYSEALDIANLLFVKEAVLVNFHLMEEFSAARVIDFLTGTVFALDGDIQRVDNEIFLVTPNNMEISSDVARSLLNQASVN